MSIPGFIRRNWKLKVGCFLIASFTWVGVVYAGNPPETKVVSLAVPQSPSNVPAPYVLVHPVTAVLVRIGGDQNTLDSLNPAVLNMTVDWAAVKHAGTYSIPITITSSDPSIALISPPTTLQVDMDVFTSKSVPITIHITSPPPVGYESGPQQTTPSTVVVSGPERELVGIAATVTVNLSTQKTNFLAALPVLVDTKAGAPLTNVNASPADVNVTITIIADVTTEVVAVHVRTVGSPSPGHFLTGIVVSPLTVVATGSRDLLNTFDAVDTTPIQLNGVFGFYTISVTILAPAGVTLSQSKVTVTIEVGTVPAPPPTPTPSPTPSPT